MLRQLKLRIKKTYKSKMQNMQKAENVNNTKKIKQLMIMTRTVVTSNGHPR